MAFDRLGGAEYLFRVANEDPRTFCGLLGKILPTQITGDDDGPLKIQDVSAAELARRLAFLLAAGVKE